MSTNDGGARGRTASTQSGQTASGVTPVPPSRRLEDILRQLPSTELDGLIRRMGIRIDEQKRIDVPSQVARALVGQPDLRDSSRLPQASQELLHRLAEAGGKLVVDGLPPGFEQLMARGIIFIRRVQSGFEVVLPAAYLVQLPAWPGEDPRAIRGLLAQASFETASAIAGHYLGRPATPPIALALESAWDALSDAQRLEHEIESLPLQERRLLEAIDEQGGEVETPELLDLEREPMRLRSAKGVSTTRRGAGFALERRAFLIPIHPNRHVIPTEVAALVGADRKRKQVERRERIRREVLGEDYLPRRASFARDVAGITLSLALAARESGVEVRPNVGTPRSLILRLAQRFGRSPDAVCLVTALSRAIGLWEHTAQSMTTPPGSLEVGDLGKTLFDVWRGGGAYDEARTEPEVLRAPPDQREASPLGPLRDVIACGLLDLGGEGWVPFASFARYVLDEPRMGGIERLLRRWTERLAAGDPPPLEELVQRIVLEVLPVLGVVDVGYDSLSDQPSAADGGLASGVALRVTARGRELLDPTLRSASRDALAGQKSEFKDTHVLRVGTEARIAAVLSLGALSEVGRVEDSLDLLLSPSVIARAIEAGALGEEIRERIEAVAPMSSSLSQLLERASVVVGKASLVLSSAFLWVDDPEVRELLRTRRSTAELFVDPSPPGGLLVAGGVELERVIRRARGVGVEIQAEGTEGGARAVMASLTPRPQPVVDAHRSGTRVSPKRTPSRSRTPLPRTK